MTTVLAVDLGSASDESSPERSPTDAWTSDDHRFKHEAAAARMAR